MARSKGLSIRRVKTRDERKGPSVFKRLKADEQFKAHALFEPDPELEDNPGFYEFFRHWDQEMNRYVPCTDDRCPYCLGNDNPWPAALSVWYFPDNEKREQLQVFTLNNRTSEDLFDTSENDGGVLGKKFRVKRMDDRGAYKVVTLSDKKLTKKEISTLLKEMPFDLEELVLSDAKRALERSEAISALSDDDDDEDEKPKARRGKAKQEEPDDDDGDGDEGETPEDIEEEELEILSVSKKNNTIKVEWENENVVLGADEDEIDVSEFSKGDTVTVSATYDEDDEEWTLTSLEAAEGDGEEDGDGDEDGDGEEDGEDEETMEGEEFKIVSTSEADEYVTVTDGDDEFDLWIGEGVEIDYDDLKKNTKIVVDASKDDEGDWVATSFEVKAPARRSGSKTSSRRKTGAKK